MNRSKAGLMFAAVALITGPSALGAFGCASPTDLNDEATNTLDPVKKDDNPGKGHGKPKPPPDEDAGGAGDQDAGTQDPPLSSSPGRDAIIKAAGLSNPSAVPATKSAGIKTTQDGQVIENCFTSGVVVDHNNVTIRNCRIEGSSSTALVRPARGIRGTTVEHCQVVVDDNGANGGIGYLGISTTVRFSRVFGFADGIKIEGGTSAQPSFYEGNYIKVSKPAESAKHLDGMQASADSYYVVRGNVVDAPISDGGNAAIFLQAWNGSSHSNIQGMVIENNYLSGGNYTVYLEGGKLNQADSNPDKCAWIVGSGYTLRNNVFTDGSWRYGPLRYCSCTNTATYGNTFDTGSDPAKLNGCGM